MESLYQDYKDEGFLVVQLIGADFGGAYPQQADLIAWINYIKSQYGATITYDVAADPYFTIGSMYNKTGYIPYYWLVDQDLVINYKASALNPFRAKIETLLGLE